MFGSSAQALTADDVLNEMPANEQSAYLQGVIGGLAFSRYLRDKPDKTGMRCIYDWYYEGGVEQHRRINQWFERHITKPAEPLLYVLIKKECGE